MPRESIGVIELLLDVQLKECIADLQNTVYDFILEKVTSQHLSPREVEYKFYGLLLEGADIIVGEAELTVQATTHVNNWGVHVNYTCHLEKSHE